jgi:flagellar capping protein FliD
MFSLDKLKVYDKALANAASLAQHSRSWDKRHAVTDQLLRASESFVLNLAEGARLRSARPLHATSDVSTLTLGAAGFATPIVAGTFTVNGARVEVDPSETLQQVFDRIASATGNSVTAAYDPATDRIRLSSAGAIVLGSATDTGNFLQAARLHNNGTGEVTSASTLGRLQLNATMETARFSTGVTDGGEGTGMFRINGVEIEFGAGDTIDQVLRRIHDSAAGVSASYDVANDRFLLANRTTGDVGIGLEDVRGNFLAATGLAGGTLERGNDLLYTVNNGGVLRSQSNTITEGSSGLAGLTVTALREGVTSTVHVQTDTGAIRGEIVQFLEEYNKVQSMLESQTGRSVDSKGAITAGVLAGELEAGGVGARLRSLAYSQQAGLSGSIRHLEALGIVSNGNNNQLQLADPGRRDEALANDLTAVRDLFMDPVHGLAPRMGEYLEQIAGEDGRLNERQGALDRQAGQIDVQLLNLERLVQSNRQRMIDSFVTMETVQANLNQQLEFLQRRFATNASNN